MDFLTIQSAYAITLGVLLFSTILSRLELISIPIIYINFVFPSDIKYKLIKWRVLNFSVLFFSITTGVFFFLKLLFLFKLFLILTTLILIITYTIRKIGKDGSDQMRILAYMALSLCLLLDNETGQLIAIAFLGIQALISYSTSGLAKMFSPYWRAGNVLAEILGTYSYGIPKVSSFLKRYPFLEKIMSYGAIATMLAVPICFLIPFQLPLLIALCCIFMFHLSTAILMGLNDFLFTFPLTYPGLLVLHSLLFNY